MKVTTVGLCGLLALGVGCNSRSKAFHIAEATDATILNDWQKGGLTTQADNTRGKWKAGLETLQLSQLGPAQTVEAVKMRVAAQGAAEVSEVKRLTALNEAMKAGKPVADNAGDAMELALVGPRDGKTPQQRAADYAPKIAENERAIVAHQQAADACTKAIAQLKAMD